MMNFNISIRLSDAQRLTAAMAVVVLLNLGGCTTHPASYQQQKTFDSPQSAVDTLVKAARTDDVSVMEAIFGPEAHEVLASGDPIADRHNREVFVVAMEGGWSLERKDSHTRELIVGPDQWPFPIPIVKDRHGWWFDTEAGKQEVLARRIGRNELAAISSLRAFVVAQRKYAGEGHDGRPAGIYAQRVQSEQGTHNGLYWPPSPDGKDQSPLGESVAQAAVEGYTAASQAKLAPFHGYYFKILTEQGPAAPGGVKDYIVNGVMTQGFAGIAYPAEYGSSGIMSFIVGQDGVVHEANFGDDTRGVAGAITNYNPDSRWRITK